MSRFTVIDCEQRSEMWRAARAGRVTASRASDVFATIKTGEAAARRNYRAQLVAEVLTGEPQEDPFVSKGMQRGINLEDGAIAAYEAVGGLVVRKTGFLAMTEIAAGCSLDGDVDDFKLLVSIKVPFPATHLAYFKAKRLPPEYVHQATHEMWVTGAAAYDFVSYCPALPAGLDVFSVRVDRSEFDLAAHEAGVISFLREVDAEVSGLRKYCDGAPLLA